MHIDTPTREKILQAMLESSDGRKAYRIIPLLDGNRLLMMAHCGNVAFALLDDADDFNPHFMRDVSALVEADLRQARLAL